MRIAPLMAAVALLTACQSHPKTTSVGPTPTPTNVSPRPCDPRCPPPQPTPYPQFVTSVDGVRATFRPVTRVTFQGTHHVVVKVHLLHGGTASWKIGESDGNRPQGTILASGPTISEGQVITFDWKPRLTGSRSLTMQLSNGLSGSVADLQVYGGTRLAVVDDCRHPAVKPRTIMVACGDGAEHLENVRYATWDRSAAYGTATVVANDDKPDRARGHDHSYSAHIRLSRVREFPEGPRFTVLQITFDGPRPHGQRVETTPI